MSSNSGIVPKFVFIVPYRNREHHRFFFTKYLLNILKIPANEYEIYFSHQLDARCFNRGATKNIGFIALKKKYPNHYKNIVFVFNDIDTLPYDDILDYSLVPGTAKHFYGFEYALGGIVAFRGEDFEKTNGYPNFWGWGMEDNVLQKRCGNHNIKIDRNQFYPIGNSHILQLFDGVSRFINKKDPWRATHDDGVDGIKTISGLRYKMVPFSNNNNVFIIDITSFMTRNRYEQDNYYKYDLREPPRKIIHPSKIPSNKTVVTDDWTDIPNSLYSAPDDSGINNTQKLNNTRNVQKKDVATNIQSPKPNEVATAQTAQIEKYLALCNILNSSKSRGNLLWK